MKPDVPPDFFTIVDAARFHEQGNVFIVFSCRRKEVGDTRARKLVEHFGAVRFESRVAPAPERRVGRERVYVRQKIAHGVHNLDTLVAATDTYVNVQTKNQVRAGHVAQLLDQAVVAFVRGDKLGLPVRKRVGSGSGYLEVLLVGEFNNFPSEKSHFLAGLLDIMADIGTYFHHCLVHFGLHPLLKHYLATFDQFRHMRPEFAGYGVNRLKLFFDSEGKNVHSIRRLKGKLICADSKTGSKITLFRVRGHQSTRKVVFLLTGKVYFWLN